VDPPACTDTDKHIVTNILLDQKRIEGIRFSVSNIFWLGYDFHDSLPDRVYGTMQKWINIKGLLPKILWDDEGTDTALSLMALLPPSVEFNLEVYASGHPPPKAKHVRGMSGPRTQEEARAEQDGDEADSDAEQTVDIEYKDGARTRVQEWRYRAPEAINRDARHEPRVKPKINLMRSEYGTPYKMWRNVCLPWGFMDKMWGAHGYINQRLTGKDNSYKALTLTRTLNPHSHAQPSLARPLSPSPPPPPSPSLSPSPSHVDLTLTLTLRKRKLRSARASVFTATCLPSPCNPASPSARCGHARGTSARRRSAHLLRWDDSVCPRTATPT
jgi:hypothetical protein